MCGLRADKQLSIEHEIKHNTNRLQLNIQFAVEQRMNIIEMILMTATWSKSFFFCTDNSHRHFHPTMWEKVVRHLKNTNAEGSGPTKELAQLTLNIPRGGSSEDPRG